MVQKYSKWADKAGVNPFFPSRAPIPASIISKCIAYTFAGFVALPRLVLSFSLVIILGLVLSLLTGRSMLSMLLLFGMATQRGDKGANQLLGFALNNNTVLAGVAILFLVRN